MNSPFIINMLIFLKEQIVIFKFFKNKKISLCSRACLKKQIECQNNDAYHSKITAPFPHKLRFISIFFFFLTNVGLIYFIISLGTFILVHYIDL